MENKRERESERVSEHTRSVCIRRAVVRKRTRRRDCGVHKASARGIVSFVNAMKILVAVSQSSRRRRSSETKSSARARSLYA